VVTRFEQAFQGLRTTGASVSTHEVVEALDRHGGEEAELLERYQRFVEEAESPAARYLVQLILDDEQRHHRVLEELANSIAWVGRKGCPKKSSPSFQGTARTGLSERRLEPSWDTNCEIALNYGDSEGGSAPMEKHLCGACSST